MGIPPRLVLLALPLLPTLPARGDEIVLRGGARLSGEVVEQNDREVVIRLPHGTMTVPRDRIERVVRESRGAFLAREAATSIRRGSWSDALRLLAAAEREGGGAPGLRDLRRRALLGLAGEQLADWRLAEAERTARELHGWAPGDGEVAALLARLEMARAETDRLRAEALAALEAGDWAAAIARLETWRLRRPPDDRTARELLARAWTAQAEALERGGELRGALDAWRSAALCGGGTAAERALFRLAPIAVVEELAAGDVATAARRLEAIRTRYPDPAVPRFLHGILDHLAGEAAEAVRHYGEAARLAEEPRDRDDALSYELVRDHATAVLQRSLARPAGQGEQRWRETFLDPLERADSERHVTVYAVGAARARELAAEAERLYEELARELLGAVPATGPGDRVRIVVHPTRQAYVAADPVPESSPLSGLVLPRERTGGVTGALVDAHGATRIRVELHEGDPGLLTDTLPHELVHAVQRRGLPAYRRAHWLDEAVAMLAESAAGRAMRLRRARRLPDPMPLERLFALRSTPRARSDEFYDQAYAFAAFLRERGSAREWKAFLERAGRGPVDEALRETWGFDGPGELERAWRHWLRGD